MHKKAYTKSMTPETFQQEFEALLTKYSGVCTVVAIPTRIYGKDGYWHDSAELRVAVVPPSGVPSATSDQVVPPIIQSE